MEDFPKDEWIDDEELDLVEDWAEGLAPEAPGAAPHERTEDEQNYYEHWRYVADKGQKVMRVDKFISILMGNTSRSRIQTGAEEGLLHVNGKPVRSNYKVKPGDVVALVLSRPKRIFELVPEDIPLDIVHEDEDVVVVNKPAGMVVHPSFGHYSGTLVNALAHHLRGVGAFDKGDFRPGLVHRLDRNTSGLIVVGKNIEAKNHLARQFFDRTTQRRYQALVWGNLAQDEGTIVGNVGRGLRDRKVREVFPEGDQGKHAVTHYKVLERFGYVTLVECRLETGRTHQIRVHMRYLGHPLFNDDEYGGDRILKGTTFTKYKQFVQNCFKLMPRQALHARTLGFAHPRTGQALHFEAPLPPDMASVLEKWRGYVAHRSDNEMEEELNPSPKA